MRELFARGRIVSLTLLLAASLVGGIAWAARSVSCELNWWTVDGGGQTFSSGNGYTLGGTAGQADAGVLSGGGYTVGGGFWGGAAAVDTQKVYLPLVLR